MKQQIRTIFFGMVALLISLESGAQLISTRDPLGAQAQILLHLDGLETTWEVKEARETQRKQGSAPSSRSETTIPGDMQLSLQLKAIQGEMDFHLYPRVRDFVQLFARKKRDRTEAMMGLADRYFPALEHELARRNMPDNLKFLPAALSALNQQAIAENGATGLWQLPFHAAIRHGLTCNAVVDERRDWEKSTRAALSYLNQLQQQYNDWTLAITAFTCGAGSITQARNRAGRNAGFEKMYPYLPEAGRDYVPAFMAAAYVMRYHQVLGLQALSIAPLVQEDKVPLAKPVSLASVAKVLRIPKNQLQALNPSCRLSTIDGNLICLPPGYGSRFSSNKEAIYAMDAAKTAPAPVAVTPEPKVRTTTKANPPKEKPEPVEIPANSVALKYKIKPGDNLGAISKTYNVKIAQLKSWNSLENDNIRADDILTIHVPKNQAGKYRNSGSNAFDERQDVKSILKTMPKVPMQPKYRHYTVKKGDSLWEISQQYPGVSPEDIMELNQVGEDIRPGQKLKIPAQTK